tara:strand:- start:270 stop:626 length:357 start_codon:yes stop_codon:yes gene_type:complete
MSEHENFTMSSYPRGSALRSIGSNEYGCCPDCGENTLIVNDVVINERNGNPFLLGECEECERGFEVQLRLSDCPIKWEPKDRGDPVLPSGSGKGDIAKAIAESRGWEISSPKVEVRDE